MNYFFDKQVLLSATILLAFISLLMTGCSPSKPDVVAASGVVMINDKPLPNAEIRFMPMLEGLDGNAVAYAVSDEKGEFTLKLPGKEESGCYACTCKVLVVEGPVPDELRRGHENGTNPGGLKKFKNSLSNRPIPPEYSRPGNTPLSFDVSAENNKFEVKLTR